MSQKNDSVNRTILIALILSLACSIIVSFAAVYLRPIQEKNQALDKKKNILMAASLYEEGLDVEEVFSKNVRAKVVNLKDGDYVDSIEASDYDQYKKVKEDSERVELSQEEDFGAIRAVARYAVVYEVFKEGNFDQVVLPIHGKGLWSTLYGFVALSSDLNTVNGLGFYQHAETPGLGGEVDNPKWKALWKGKKVSDDQGQYRLQVLKGAVLASHPLAHHQVDGLSGATITARGVDAMLKFWLGENGFYHYLQRLKQGGV